MATTYRDQILRLTQIVTKDGSYVFNTVSLRIANAKGLFNRHENAKAGIASKHRANILANFPKTGTFELDCPAHASVTATVRFGARVCRMRIIPPGFSRRLSALAIRARREFADG